MELAPFPRPTNQRASGRRLRAFQAAVNCYDVGALPQSQSRKEARNAEHVVEMAMRQ
jgi:hypothetical protein